MLCDVRDYFQVRIPKPIHIGAVHQMCAHFNQLQNHVPTPKFIQPLITISYNIEYQTYMISETMHRMPEHGHETDVYVCIIQPSPHYTTLYLSTVFVYPTTHHIILNIQF